MILKRHSGWASGAPRSTTCRYQDATSLVQRSTCASNWRIQNTTLLRRCGTVKSFSYTSLAVQSPSAAACSLYPQHSISVDDQLVPNEEWHDCMACMRLASTAQSLRTLSIPSLTATSFQQSHSVLARCGCMFDQNRNNRNTIAHIADVKVIKPYLRNGGLQRVAVDYNVGIGSNQRPTAAKLVSNVA